MKKEQNILKSIGYFRGRRERYGRKEYRKDISVKY